MKERVTLSLQPETVAFLTGKAKAETRGNVSAYVDQLARQAALEESVQQHADWYAARPGHAEDADAERTAAHDDRDAA